ncbi:MAG TPA: hypothetical protein VJP58_10430 [Candidatus Nitrosocosmicus sp.]|nr:hypothetical protein [Candidatus Nitrosocosmicus sp.]
MNGNEELFHGTVCRIEGGLPVSSTLRIFSKYLISISPIDFDYKDGPRLKSGCVMRRVINT